MPHDQQIEVAQVEAVVSPLMGVSKTFARSIADQDMRVCNRGEGVTWWEPGTYCRSLRPMPLPWLRAPLSAHTYFVVKEVQAGTPFVAKGYDDLDGLARGTRVLLEALDPFDPTGVGRISTWVWVFAIDTKQGYERVTDQMTVIAVAATGL